MYEGWRVFKRNPFIWDTKGLGFCFLGFITIGVIQYYVAPYSVGYVHISYN